MVERLKSNNDIRFYSKAPLSQTPSYRPLDENTRSVVYGLHPRAIEAMLDFDYSCGHATPFVVAMVWGHHTQKFYGEALLPVYTSVKEAVAKHPDAGVVKSTRALLSV